MNFEKLKELFDGRVVLKHYKPTETESGYTLGALIYKDRVFIGISRCHELDQFNRRLGREMALGRAFIAFKEWKNPPSIEDRRSREYLRSVHAITEDRTVHDILKKHIFSGWKVPVIDRWNPGRKPLEN